MGWACEGAWSACGIIFDTIFGPHGIWNYSYFFLLKVLPSGIIRRF